MINDQLNRCLWDVCLHVQCDEQDVSFKYLYNKRADMWMWKLVIKSNESRPRLSVLASSPRDAYNSLKQTPTFRKWRASCGCCPYHTRGGDAYVDCCEFDR